MDTFAFIIHPIDPKRDVSRKFPLLGKYLTDKQINFFSTFFPPIYISEITGIRSEATGKEVRGWFVACPFTPARMMELPEKTVYRKIVQTGQNGRKAGRKNPRPGCVHFCGGGCRSNDCQPVGYSGHHWGFVHRGCGSQGCAAGRRRDAYPGRKSHRGSCRRHRGDREGLRRIAGWPGGGTLFDWPGPAED